MLPPTADRVRNATADHVNARIDREMRSRLEEAAANPDLIERRLLELDREWDIERTLEANAAGLALAGIGLGALVDRRFLWLSAGVTAFLLQHALQGWCPPIEAFRRMGVRTAREIDEERMALKALRGDFAGATTPASALAAVH